MAIYFCEPCEIITELSVFNLCILCCKCFGLHCFNTENGCREMDNLITLWFWIVCIIKLIFGKRISFRKTNVVKCKGNWLNIRFLCLLYDVSVFTCLMDVHVGRIDINIKTKLLLEWVMKTLHSCILRSHDFKHLIWIMRTVTSRIYQGW